MIDVMVDASGGCYVVLLCESAVHYVRSKSVYKLQAVYYLTSSSLHFSLPLFALS